MIQVWWQDSGPEWLTNPLDRKVPTEMERDFAEMRALQVLAWLAGSDDLLPVFLGASGLSERDLRDGAGDADMLASLLDFVLSDDAWVIDCAQALSVPPTEIMAIRQALPGGGLPHWT